MSICRSKCSVLSILLYSWATLWILAPTVQAQNVEIEGRIWRQVSETQNLDWNQIASVCPVGGGVCNGTVGGRDLTGWTWATRDEVNALFQHYNPMWPGGLGFQEEVDSAWAPSAREDFNNTNTSGSAWVVEGMMATGSAPFGDFAFIFDLNPGGSDQMRAGTRPRTAIVPNAGAWLYQHATTPVPLHIAPALVLGCLWMGARRLRR